MWGQFVLACIAVAAFVFVPGYLLLRAFAQQRVYALAYAPVLATAAYTVQGIVYAKLGIFANWATVVLPVLAAGVCAYAVSFALARPRALGARGVHSLAKGPAASSTPAGPSGLLDLRAAWKYLVLFVLAGIAATWYAYLQHLGSPDSFIQMTDNTVHLNIIRAFYDSGNWSSLGASAYQLAGEADIKPFLGKGAFYPSAWYCLCALAMSACGVAAPMAENAVNCIMVAVVFPISLYVLLAKIFDDDKAALACGAVMGLAFVAFPWAILTFGPLFANVASYAVFPAVARCVMDLMDCLVERRFFVGKLALALVGFVSLALLQPNALFFGVVFASPYCVAKLWGMQTLRSDGSRGALGRVLAVAFALFVVAVWLLLYKAPFMSSVVHYDSWKPMRGPLGALFDIATAGYHVHPAQVVLGLLVLAGVVREAVARKRWWLVVVFAIAAVQFFACEVLTGRVRHVLCGFWYCDTYRLAANLAIVSVPFACSGLSGAYSSVAGRFAKGKGKSGTRKVLAVGLALLFVCLNFWPTIEIPGAGKLVTAYGNQAGIYLNRGNIDKIKVYTHKERDFAKRAQEITGDALVINRPYDGSIYAYGDVGMRTYYRTLYRHNPKESPECITIRTKLDKLEKDAEVQAAVKAIDAEYVMILDRNTDSAKTPQPRKYDEGLWTGISAVEDATPGFETVLAQGDMRLYKITGVN